MSDECNFCKIPVKEFHTRFTWDNVSSNTMCVSCKKRYDIFICERSIRQAKRWIKKRQTWINNMDNLVGVYSRMPKETVLMGRDQFRREIANCHKHIKHAIKCIEYARALC